MRSRRSVRVPGSAAAKPPEQWTQQSTQQQRTADDNEGDTQAVSRATGVLDANLRQEQSQQQGERPAGKSQPHQAQKAARQADQPVSQRPEEAQAEERPEAIGNSAERCQQPVSEVTRWPGWLGQITDGGHDVQMADAVGR